MEDDFSQVVGINLEMWLALIIFIIISGPLGWAVLIFLILATVMQLVINTKLTMVIRHVCRHGKETELASNIFWFKRPSLLLPFIKFNLFLCSYLYSAPLFFAWQFGQHSCPFTNKGFWWAWVVPWWTSLIFGAALFLNLSLRTLPMYSLAVQMGSDFKHHMLPKGIKLRLLKMAEHIRDKNKQQKAERAGQKEARMPTDGSSKAEGDANGSSDAEKVAGKGVTTLA